MTMPNDDEWCREESCRHRHWRSGSMPTHKRGADCPPPMTAPSPAGLSPLLDQLDEAPPMTPGVARLVIRDLTAALRGCLSWADQLDREALALGAMQHDLHKAEAAQKRDAAAGIRAARAAALTPGADTAGATA